MARTERTLGGNEPGRWWPLVALVVWLASGAAANGLDPGKRITQYVHDVWQTADGLPANDVQAIVHGRDGFLWLATRGGLARFDGVRFEVFNMVNTPAFGSDDFGALAEGAGGSLWIASRGAGLYRYRDGAFTSFPGPDPSRSDVRAVVVDRDGELWAGSLGGLLRLSGGRLAAVAGTPLADADIRALYQDADGTLWIGTNGAGVFRRREGDFEALAAAGLSSAVVGAVLRDRAGALWVGTNAGLYRVAAEQVTVYGRPEGLIDEDVQDLYEDAAGSLWVATNSELARLRDASSTERRRFESYMLRPGTAADLVRTVTADREGNLWAGTYGSGLHRFQVGPVTAYSQPEGLLHDGVWSVYGTPAGDLLAGFGDGGIDRLRDGAVDRLAAPGVLPPAAVYSMLEDSRGALWIGTGAGLVRSDSAGRVDGRRIYTTADGLPDDRVRIVLEDPGESGTLWLGTFGGVARWRDGVFERFNEAQGLPADNVRALFKDRAGALWVGVESGLWRLREGEVSVFTSADGLGSSAIRAFHEDADGDLWIGTRGGGLTRLRDGTLTAYTTRQGLPHNDVWAILEDGEGHLWWSSDQGLTRVRKADFEAYDRGRLAALPARTYGLADGMKVIECNGVGYPSGWKSDDGMLYFASMGGIVEVDPRPRPAAVAPPVYVESLAAGAVRIDPGAVVELAPGERNLEIAYTSPRLRDPERVRFRYRLEGYDPQWVDAGARRTAYYTNLPAGSYRFLVAAGGDQETDWTEAAPIALILAPHFWETRWFYAGCALSALLLAYHGFRIGTQSIRSRNQRLRAEITQRQRAEAEREVFVRELEAKNAELERFTYTVSHDLKSPLVTIQGFLGFLRKDIAALGTVASAEERVERDIERIAAAAGKMQRLLDEILELSRVGRQINEPRELELGGLVAEALELVSGALEERGVAVEVEPGLPVVVGDRVRLIEVFQNLLENSVRYMGDQAAPRVAVGTRPNGSGMVCCWVRDNGIGIDPRYHDKVFGLFERLDSETEGTGVGLALVQRIVELHGGRIWIESQGEGHGSTFCFTLPLPDGARRGG